MKSHPYYFLFFVVLSVLSGSADEINTSDWGSITNGMQMSISLKGGGKEIKANQPCRLIIRIKNASTNNMVNFVEDVVANTDLLIGVSCVVISPSSKDISPNTEKTYFGSSGRFMTVPPNATKEFEFNLIHLCKFDEVGTYKIVAKKRMMSGNHEELVSNPLSLTIIPGEWKAETNALSAGFPSAGF